MILNPYPYIPTSGITLGSCRHSELQINTGYNDVRNGLANELRKGNWEVYEE